MAKVRISPNSMTKWVKCSKAPILSSQYGEEKAQCFYKNQDNSVSEETLRNSKMVNSKPSCIFHYRKPFFFSLTHITSTFTTFWCCLELNTIQTVGETKCLTFYLFLETYWGIQGHFRFTEMYSVHNGPEDEGPATTTLLPPRQTWRT